MKILGIDPGYGILGWSIIDSNQKLIDYGVIETESGLPIEQRLLDIHKKLLRLISLHKPDCAAIERLFFTKNIKTGMDVAKTIGVVILTLSLRDIGCHEYTPSQVKQAITGYGRADKNQMKFMIKSIFKMKDAPTPDDAADALAIALCHSLRRPGRV